MANQPIPQQCQALQSQLHFTQSYDKQFVQNVLQDLRLERSISKGTATEVTEGPAAKCMYDQHALNNHHCSLVKLLYYESSTIVTHSHRQGREVHCICSKPL